MAATTGTLYLIGKSGRTYSVDTYVEDAATGVLRFNPTGLAGAASAVSLRVPEDCVIYDIAVEAKPTASGFVFVNNSGVINGGAVRFNVQLTSLSNRGKVKIPLTGGDLLSANNF